MRTTLTTLAISGIVGCFCAAQESGPLVATNVPQSNLATRGPPNAPPAATEAPRNRRVIEANAQFELLSQLAHEHQKRAEATPREQGRYQWESDLAKELGDRAAAIQSLLTNTSNERLTSETAPLENAASAPSNSVTGATKVPRPEEIAFLEALAARRTAVQQELATAYEAASLYVQQVATNSSYSESANLHYLIRDNAYSVKQLQKELFDLELKHLEFRALRKP